MATLVDLFATAESALAKRSADAQSTQEALAVLQHELAQYAGLQGEYMRSLSVPQARVATAMLAFLRQSLGITATVGAQSLAPPQNAKGSAAEATPVMEREPTTSQHAHDPDASSPANAPIRALISVVRAIADVFRGGRTGSGETTPVRKVEQTVVRDHAADLHLLGPHVREVLGLIDSTIAALDTPRQATSRRPNLADHPDLLRFLQDLIGEAMDEQAQLGPRIQARLKEIGTLLRHEGIHVELYQPGIVREDADALFDFEPPLDPYATDYVTLTPALVKEGEVLLQGRVIEPAVIASKN